MLKGLKGKLDRDLIKKIKKNREPDQDGDWCKPLCEADASLEECQQCCINVNHRVDWFCDEPENPQQAACCTNWTAECYTISGENNNNHACNECGGYGRGGGRGYGYGRRLEEGGDGRGYGGRRMEEGEEGYRSYGYGRRMEEGEEGYRGYGYGRRMEGRGYGRGGRRLEESNGEN